MRRMMLSSVAGSLLLSALLLSQDAQAQIDNPTDVQSLPEVVVSAGYSGEALYGYVMSFYDYSSGAGVWGWYESDSVEPPAGGGGSSDSAYSFLPPPTHKLRVWCTRADGPVFTDFYLSNDGTCSSVDASYLQQVCDAQIWGTSTYTSCVDLVRGQYGGWVPNEEAVDTP
jgi:hypothetical protein